MASSNVPPGLKCLLPLDRLRIDVAEYDPGVPTKYQLTRGYRCYTIQNSTGQTIFDAHEDPEAGGHRIKFMPLRCFVLDGTKQQIMTIVRFPACGVHFCQLKGEVTGPSGTPIGYLLVKLQCCCGSIYVEDGRHQLIMCIDIPFRNFLCATCAEVAFPIYTSDRNYKMGEIVRARGAARYEVSFPIDLEARMKAVLLGATLFMDGNMT